MGSRVRAAAAVKAALVADAASMGSHWIYSVDELKKVLASDWDTPEFHEPPSCPFYDSTKNPGHYASGDPSPYAEEMLALLSHMKTRDGALGDGQAFAESLKAWAGAYGGRKNHATTLFEDNVAKLEAAGKGDALYPDCGADDAQANVFWKCLPIAARYLGSDEYMAQVEVAVRTHQNKDEAVEFAHTFSRMLAAACGGADLVAAVKSGADGAPASMDAHIAKALDLAIKGADADDDSQENLERLLADYAAEIFGAMDDPPAYLEGIVSRSCGFPQSLVIGIKIALDAEQVAKAHEAKGAPLDVFEYACRRNMHAGGDTCGRVPVFAGLLAAAGHVPPASWTERTSALPDIEDTLALLLQ